MIGASVSSSSPLWRKIEGKRAWRTVPSPPAPPVIPQPALVVPVPSIAPDASAMFDALVIACRLAAVQAPPPPRDTVKVILRRVARMHKVTVDDILSDRRPNWLIKPRFHAAWLLYRFTKLTLPGIGKRMNRDHSSVMHALSRVTAQKPVRAARYKTIRTKRVVVK
jgi:hypothetical protein